MKETVLRPYFDKLAESGGTGTCHVYMHRAEGEHTVPEDADIDRINVRVDLMVPITFSGHELLVQGSGLDVDCAKRSLKDMKEMGHAINSLRLSAYRRAVQDLDNDIRMQLRKVRPGISTKRTSRKARIILSNFDSWKFV